MASWGTQISLQVYQDTFAFKVAGKTAASRARILVSSVISSSYPKVIKGSTGMASGPGHKIADALNPFGSCHVIEAPSPASPGFFQ